MARKARDKDVIRWSLLDAIEWRKSLLASYEGTAGYGRVQAEIRAKIINYESLLHRRYGGVPADPLAGAEVKDIRDI